MESNQRHRNPKAPTLLNLEAETLAQSPRNNPNKNSPNNSNSRLKAYETPAYSMKVPKLRISPKTSQNQVKQLTQPSSFKQQDFNGSITHDYQKTQQFLIGLTVKENKLNTRYYCNSRSKLGGAKSKQSTDNSKSPVLRESKLSDNKNNDDLMETVPSQAVVLSPSQLLQRDNKKDSPRQHQKSMEWIPPQEIQPNPNPSYLSPDASLNYLADKKIISGKNKRNKGRKIKVFNTKLSPLRCERVRESVPLPNIHSNDMLDVPWFQLPFTRQNTGDSVEKSGLNVSPSGSRENDNQRLSRQDISWTTIHKQII